MKEENIMENEAIETAEEIVSSGSGIGLKVIGGVVAIAGLTYGAYKLYKKHKANKESKDDDSVICDEADYLDVDED